MDEPDVVRSYAIVLNGLRQRTGAFMHVFAVLDIAGWQRDKKRSIYMPSRGLPNRTRVEAALQAWETPYELQNSVGVSDRQGCVHVPGWQKKVAAATLMMEK